MAQQDNINVNGLSLPVWAMQSTAQQIDDAVSAVLEWQEDPNNPGCYYHMVGGVQEWLNPPMQLGVEYRTTERYHGKPVYAKLISLGLLPDNSLKVVAVSDNIHRVVDLKLDVQGSNTVVNNAVYSRISAAANGVTIETVYPASSLGEAWAYVKYTKTTD